MNSINAVDFNSTWVQSVGFLSESIIKKVNLICNSYEVQVHPGAIKHIKKRHPGIIEKYGHIIPNIVAYPSFVGCHPKVPNSLELVSKFDEYLLVAIKLDESGYLFISSFYILNNGHYKVKERIRCGRLIFHKNL